MKHRALITSLVVLGLAGLLAVASTAQSALAIDELTLCSAIRGDGDCTIQPYGAYAPVSRLWARADLSGFAHGDETIDLELVMEVQAPDGQVLHRSTVIDGPQTVPAEQQSVHAVITYDIPPDAPAGDYVLRLALHDRLSDTRANAEKTFLIERKETVATALPVELSGRNLAAQITAHGVALANEIAGHPAPQGQLFLVVDTTWRNFLVDRVYGVRLEMLAFVTVDDQLDYPYVDLGRYLEGALPSELYIEVGGRTRGLLAFAAPGEFTSAALRYRDDVIGKGDIIIPLFDLGTGDEIDFPEPGIGGDEAIVPSGAGGIDDTDGQTGPAQPDVFNEVEPNNGWNQCNPLPTAESFIISGTLESKSDTDGFLLTIDTPERMIWAFELSGLPEVDINLDVRIEQGGVVQVDNGREGEREATYNVGLEAGAHRLFVSARKGENPNLSYRLVARATGQARANEEFEFNNNWKFANQLTMGETMNGVMNFARDADCYQLHLDQDTSLALTLSPLAKSNLSLQLLDADARNIDMINLGKKGEPEYLSSHWTAGDYFLVVHGDENANTRYTLSVMPVREEGLNQDLEDNDEQTRAGSIEDGAVIDGSFQGTDEDWFVIENNTGGEQVVKAVMWGALRATLALYAPSGELLAGGRNAESYVYARVPPGLTYVQATGRMANYQLLVWMDQPGPVDDPRTAAQLGLNSLLPSAVAWQNRNNCFGCHVQGMAVMGGALGLDNGYEVNGGELDALVTFMQAQQKKEYNYGGSGPLTSMLLNGMALAYHEQLVAPGDPENQAILASTAEYTAGEQRSDGRWTHSKLETPVQQGDFQATADAIKVLSRAPGDWSDAITRGVAFLAEAEPETTQDHVYRIIGLVLGDDPTYEDIIYKEVEALRAMQNPYGGWSEIEELDSSPYATGQVLYALKQAGVSVMDPMFQDGVLWLLSTQDWSGHWPPIGSSNHSPARATSFPPTMWATIGLAGTFETINVGITAPRPGMPVEGETTIIAAVESNSTTPVTRVEFYVDDALLCLDEDAPYECVWDAPSPPVPHKLKAIGHNTAGRSGEAVLFTAPLEGDGTIQVRLAPDAERPVPPNIEIVLDGSGSMMEQFEGKTRIDVAREVLQVLFDELPDDVNVALRAYGHQHYYKEGVCDDTELLVPLGPIDRAGLMAQINALNPQGKTLIGYTLRQIEGDLAGAEGQSVVVLISDGEETCGTDPCKAADELAAKGLDLQAHVVGYAVDDPAIAGQLACIAQVTGGTYLPAGSAEELVAALREAVTVEYAVYDRDGVEVARGVVDGPAITVPAGTYRVEVLTRTPLAAEGVLVRGDQLTTLEVAADGALRVP